MASGEALFNVLHLPQDRNPNVNKIAVIDWEIRLLTEEYARVHAEYVSVLSDTSKRGLLGYLFRDHGTEKLELLKRINHRIIMLVQQAKTQLATVYPKGVENQQIIAVKRAELADLSNKLNKDKGEIDGMILQLNSLDGENEVAKLQHASAFYHYIGFGVLLVIIGFLTVRAYATKSSGAIENVILILVCILLAYYIVKRFLL